jgi:uncharacterized protein YutE (UPF0331/DUF86 family)
MDALLIKEKLESLRRCVARVEQKCPASSEVLAGDLDRQDILTLNLSRAVQICVDIAAHLISGLEAAAPTTMGGAFDALADHGLLEREVADRMKKAVGFRNVAVHRYEAINWEIVFSICTRDLGDFKAFARQVAGRLDPPAPPAP